MKRQEAERVVKALRDSTDRLDAVWRNTGSFGSKNQVDVNIEVLKECEAIMKAGEE